MSFLNIDPTAIDAEDTIFVLVAAIFTSLLSEGIHHLSNLNLSI